MRSLFVETQRSNYPNDFNYRKKDRQKTEINGLIKHFRFTMSSKLRRRVQQSCQRVVSPERASTASNHRSWRTCHTEDRSSRRWAFKWHRAGRDARARAHTCSRCRRLRSPSRTKRPRWVTGHRYRDACRLCKRRDGRIWTPHVSRYPSVASRTILEALNYGRVLPYYTAHWLHFFINFLITAAEHASRRRSSPLLISRTEICSASRTEERALLRGLSREIIYRVAFADFEFSYKR